MPDQNPAAMAREAFAAMLDDLRREKVTGIGNVDFSKVTDEQVFMILDVLFTNMKGSKKK